MGGEEFHWIDIINALGVIGGLLFTAHSLRSETKTKRIANLIAITENHREIWIEYGKNRNYQRVLDPGAEPGRQRVTPEEHLFVTLVILQMSTVYEATKDHLFIELEGLRKDIGWFLSLPIPLVVWEQSKGVQNKDFVDFAEQCRKGILG